MRSRLVVTRQIHKDEPVLWIIDSEQWPRACLRAELIERGYDPYGFITIRDALDSLAQGTAATPEVIVIELRGQELEPGSVRALRDLRIPTVVLGGSLEFNDALIQELSWEVMLKRPVTLGKIADVVQKIVPPRRPSQV